MKHLARTILAVLMAVLIGTLFPVQVFADTPDYISEVKVFAGDYDAAESEGYTLLKNGDNPVDLNQKAGGGLGSKGEKAVYLGYKTTKDRSEAITDLALMNMKGGYSVQEYEALMETQMKSQILPFIDSFIKVIQEYRTNYKSKNKKNKQRATYINGILNNYSDDDTGKPLGDLLLNKTKEEMGEKAYNALSDEEKKEHADLATILAQSNGMAMLTVENLLVRAADNNDNTWLDRFQTLTYDDMLDATGLSPTDAAKQLAKQYDDDALKLLDMWEPFREELIGTDEAEEVLEEYDQDAIEEVHQGMEDFDFENATEDEVKEFAQKTAESDLMGENIANAASDILNKEYLNSIPYGDGTMLDFFTQEKEEIEDDITVLYPLVASLTEGQKAGLEFITLSQLVMIAGTEEYKDSTLEDIKPISIYDGVDRNIYKKGGVALTSDALRKEAIANAGIDDNDFSLSVLTSVFIGLTLASVAAFATTLITGNVLIKQYNAIEYLSETPDLTRFYEIKNTQLTFIKSQHPGMSAQEVSQRIHAFNMEKTEAFQQAYQTASENAARNKELTQLSERLSARADFCKKLTYGFTVAMVIISAVTTYLAWRDMQAYYDVEFTPIPHYMIDEKDLVGYNSKGEKIVLKNQSAYYKAAECNRKESDEMYEMLGTCADVNGDVGKQWLALYAEKNEVMEPILAGSLTAVVNSADIPAGYEKGIHMFGSDAAFNLNNNLYDWNNDAPSVYVYFKTDDTAASATGANFTGGALAMTGGVGVVLGAAFTALSMNTIRKKKESKTVTV